VLDQLQAIEWLLASEDLQEFADLLQLDPDWLRQELLIGAGLCKGTPRLGQRRTPKPPPTPRRKRRLPSESTPVPQRVTLGTRPQPRRLRRAR
jgi:hypothetical protein